MEQVVKRVSARMLSVLASLCLVLALVPAAAFAVSSDNGLFEVTVTEVTVESGGTTDLNDIVSVKETGTHYDFVAADGTECFTVNKHSGIVTAETVTATASSTVTIYLMDGDAVSGTSGKPCDGYDILDTATVTVTVTADENVEYGYQGDGFSIMLVSPTVTGVEVDGTTYTNTVEAQTVGKRVEFTYYQSAGLNQYLSYYSLESWGGCETPEEAYQSLAGQYIRYKDGAGNVTTVAESSSIEVTEVTDTTVTICVPVGESTGTGTLSFDAGLHTFKQSDVSTTNKSLGVDINFVFDIVAAS